MQKLLGLVRRCVDDYQMIQPGDKIAVGVSGGKDSLTLLTLLAGLRDFHPAGFTLEALTIDMGLEGMDFSPVAELCRRLNVPYTKIDTQIGPVIFEHRKEKNPCTIKTKMRRGARRKCSTISFPENLFAENASTGWSARAARARRAISITTIPASPNGASRKIATAKP